MHWTGSTRVLMSAYGSPLSARSLAHEPSNSSNAAERLVRAARFPTTAFTEKGYLIRGRGPEEPVVRSSIRVGRDAEGGQQLAVPPRARRSTRCSMSRPQDRPRDRP